MKKYYKFRFFLISIACFFTFLNDVNATTVYSIDMNIYVDEFGNASVSEIWDVYVDADFELYRPYEYLENSVVSDLVVYMDGIRYNTIYNWKPGNKLEDNAYKAGFCYNKSCNICFGVNSLGRHKYKIEYKISNFVVSVEDTDMIFWNFFPKDYKFLPLKSFIKIHSNYISSSQTKAWHHGMFGTGAVNISDGKIEFLDENVSNSVVSDKQYLTILIKFPKNTYKTGIILDKSFDYYYNKFDDREVYYTENNELLNFIIPICLNSFLILLLLFSLRYSKNNKLVFDKNCENVSYNVPPVPVSSVEQDLFYDFWLIRNFSLVENKARGYRVTKSHIRMVHFPTDAENFFVSLLLKWLHYGNIRIENYKNNLDSSDDFDLYVLFLEEPNSRYNSEIKLYNFMLQASRDGKLELKEFKCWCYNSYYVFYKWFEDVLFEKTLNLVDSNKIKRCKGRIFGIIGYNYFGVDELMVREAEKLLGVRNHLFEFISSKDKSLIDVSYWYEYLSYAQMFGIFCEVFNTMQELYPEIDEYMKQIGFGDKDICFLRNLGIASIEEARIAMIKANYFVNGVR